jgi:hypothetical protein
MQEPLRAPPVVNRALVLLTANLVVFSGYDLVSLYVDPALFGDIGHIVLAVQALASLLELGLIVLLAFAVNWARFAYCAILVVVVGCYAGGPGFGGEFASWWDFMTVWLSPMTQVLATALLFTRPASVWFRRRGDHEYQHLSQASTR